MNLKLYPHNHEAFIKVEQLLKTKGKAAVIHPTGTGKSYIAYALIVSHPDKEFLWISPNEYIYRTQLDMLEKGQGFTLKNVVFRTYAWVLKHPEKLIDVQFDYIILDEFHRVGAKRWGEGVKRILEVYPEAGVLGLTATNVRYLDRKRDMAKELFEDAIASEMSVSEAMARGILPVPNYVISAYSYREKIEQLQGRVKEIENRAKREESQNLLARLRHSLEQAEGVSEILARHIKDTHGKYIVFCRSLEHLYEMIAKVPEWFGLIDRHPHIYHVHTYNPRSQGDFYRFMQDDSNHLKLLFAIDMINEGIHVKDVDGVILLRPTVSPIVYKQQIGRALATGKKKIPVIFDMVNNFESLQYVGELVNEFEEQKELLKKYGRSAYVEVEEFRIFDEMREARQLLELLQKNLDASWDDYYEELKAYVAEKGNAKVPCGYVTADGLQLGKWLQRQKGFFRAGRMAADRKALLLELCGTMEYDNKLQFNHWMDLLRQYKEEHGDVLVKCPYITGNGERLGEWCSNMKTRYREGTLSEEVIRRLEDIGFCWSTKQKNWETGYEHAKAYCEEKGNLDVEKRYRSPDGYPLGQWLLAQRRIQSGKERGGRRLTKEQFTRLDALGMRWESQEDILFEEYVELFCRYKEKYQMTSIPTSHREEGRPLGQWAFKIRKRKKEGELPREWEERLNEIGFLWDMSFPIWYCQYRKAKEYYEENGTLTISSKYKEQHGEQLSVWLLRQRRLYREKRFDLLTEERIQLLDEIGFQWQIQR